MCIEKEKEEDAAHDDILILIYIYTAILHHILHWVYISPLSFTLPSVSWKRLIDIHLVRINYNNKKKKKKTCYFIHAKSSLCMYNVERKNIGIMKNIREKYELCKKL